MNIAIIGYGSLIWDLDNLKPHITGAWAQGAGPYMPVEFSRLSPKRKMALVLVLDPEVSAPSRTAVIGSSRTTLDQAVDDLAAREHCGLDMIGYATKDGARFAGQTPGIQYVVQKWLADTAYDGALWTDYGPNFASQTGIAFTHANALQYLQNLNKESLSQAWRYIEYAPAETDTPLRRFLRQNSWWQSLDFHLPEHH